MLSRTAASLSVTVPPVTALPPAQQHGLRIDLELDVRDDRVVVLLDQLDLDVVGLGDQVHDDVQALVEAGYKVIEPLTLGAGLSFVGLLTGRDDLMQTALTFFARADLSGFLLEGQLWMNLDPPYGFAFDTDGYWGLIVTLGVGLPSGR